MANRIDVRLGAVRAFGGRVLSPFVTLGFPDLDTSVDIAAALLRSGADMLELGVPFSDPLAEGPTIQRTSFQALRQGVTVAVCLAAVRKIRKADPDAPLVLMGYYNPILRYGLAEFARDAADAGVDGMIVVDLPREEAGPFNGLCEGHNLYLVPLLAPTSTNERIAQACKHAKGFIYCVSLAGVTGARVEIQAGVEDLVGRIGRYTNLPVLVGFGVSTRDHVEAIGRFADGAVVGSALLEAVDRAVRGDAVSAAVEFFRRLRGSGE